MKLKHTRFIAIILLASLAFTVGAGEIRNQGDTAGTFIFETYEGRLSESGNAEAIVQKLEELGGAALAASVAFSEGDHNFCYLSSMSAKGTKGDWKYTRWGGRISENTTVIRDFLNALGRRAEGAKIVEERGNANYCYVFHQDE